MSFLFVLFLKLRVIIKNIDPCCGIGTENFNGRVRESQEYGIGIVTIVC